jgi:hypothetical protein
MTGSVHAAGGLAAAAIGLPALGFALGPVFERQKASWQSVGPVGDFNPVTFVPRVITLTPGIGEAGDSLAYVRRRNPQIDTDRADRYNTFIAISSRCAHVGCPVRWVDAARSFVCPCHGGVYDDQGKRTGGPPPRPLDRFYTRVRAGMLELGPRYSVNSQLRRFSLHDPGESLDGIGPYVYPGRFSTPPGPA